MFQKMQLRYNMNFQVYIYICKKYIYGLYSLNYLNSYGVTNIIQLRRVACDTLKLGNMGRRLLMCIGPINGKS